MLYVQLQYAYSVSRIERVYEIKRSLIINHFTTMVVEFLDISSRFSINYAAFSSELEENREDTFLHHMRQFIGREQMIVWEVL